MIQSEFKKIKVSGIVSAVPKQKVILMDQYKNIFGEKIVASFIKNTGVSEQRIATEKQTASDLAYVAARKLVEEKQIDINEIGVLIFVTQTPDYVIPSTACVLHNRLNLSKNCIAYDINLGCSGFIYGMQTVCALLQSVNIKYGLLLVGDTLSKMISAEDKSTTMLFGDGAAAILLEQTEEENIVCTTQCTDGEGYKTIITQAGGCRFPDLGKEKTLWSVDGNVRSDYDMYMNGVDVFSFAISETPMMIKKFLKNHNLDVDYYDGYIFHQANMYILKNIVKACKLPKDKVPYSIRNYGNTSVSSIPMTICSAYADMKENKNMKLLTCGFGIGLSWGIATFDIQTDCIYPIIETEDYYKEGAVSHD